MVRRMLRSSGMGRRARQAAAWVACAGLLAGSAVTLARPDEAAAPTFAAAERPEIMIYAAASLRDALQWIAPACGEHAEVKVVFNFASSSELAAQILAADKADLFISADEAWMDKVADKGLVDTASRRALLSNRLVVIAPLEGGLGRMTAAADLAGPSVRRLSLANPESVPAGKYARAWLEKMGQWGAVKGKVVPALDVRAALAAVESGAVEAGVVYRTDAAISKKVRVLYEVPEGDGPAISYPVAAMSGRPQHDAARRLLDCLEGAEARAKFESFGFLVPVPAR
jgi:molybdate transport system substrate-binding protein